MDEEAAAIVRRIFAMCAGGSGPSQMARILKKEQILTPTMYAYTRLAMALFDQLYGCAVSRQVCVIPYLV